MSEEAPAWSKLLASVQAVATEQPLSTTEQAKENIRIDLMAEELALARDNRQLRKTIASLVGLGLAIEIAILFFFVLAQGLGRIPFMQAQFGLEKWTFGVFTSAVLLQTFGLATLIVRNLFPHDEHLRRRGKSR
jgi:hypothetical protein